MSMGGSTVIMGEIYSKEQVIKINQLIKKHIKDAVTSDGGNLIKKGKFHFVPTIEIVNDLFGWFNHCQTANNQYFGYDIRWQYNIDMCIYNEYSEEGEYGWHIDSMKEQLNTDSKLTCLLNLSEEPYEGGDFYTVGSDEKHNFDSGHGIIFNSLLAHKVTPITKGKRMTLTYWGSGPNWR